MVVSFPYKDCSTEVLKISNVQFQWNTVPEALELKSGRDDGAKKYQQNLM
jgi:hypothetical protein